MQALQDTGRYHHLAAINADVWPGIVTIPTGMFAASKARRAEAEFATACEKAGLDLDGPQPDLRVLYEEVFTPDCVLRLAGAGRGLHGWGVGE